MARLALAGLRGLALIGALAACLALGRTGGAAAAELKIASLDCDSNPQVVELSNAGDESQDLAGWELVSDPVADQVYDLSQIGVLAPGSAVFIESGPGAEATFTWSTDEIFRAGDSDDFARLLNAQGATISELTCTATGQATSTPAPTPTPAPPEATPTAVPLDGVPDGGGPPTAEASSLLTPLTAVVAGGSLAVTGSLTLLILWLTGAAGLVGRREPVAYQLPPPPLPQLPGPSHRRGRARSEPLILALVIALCGAILVALLVPSAGRGK